MKKRTIAILVGILCLTAMSSYAQKKNLVKGVIDAVTSKVPSAVGAQVERQVARQMGKSAYHPVFGYVPLQEADHYTATLFNVPARWDKIQVAPLLTQGPSRSGNYSAEGTSFIQAYKLFRPVHVAQAVYLWRLANPGKSVSAAHTELFKQARFIIDSVNSQGLYEMIEDYPAVKLLTWLLDENFQPRSYAELAATVTSYPKHVVLNQQGFPVPTQRADEAALLDSLLMLSGDEQMELGNNVGDLQKYKSNGKRRPQPFTLTPEEQQAAARLVALRGQAYQIPAHPTSRQLIEQAYNELESQALSYSHVSYLDEFFFLYMIYPFYENSALSGAIAHKLDELKSLGLMPGDTEFVNYVHLLVLNTMMRGTVVKENTFGRTHWWTYQYRVFEWEEVDETVWAFTQLCAMTPNNEENITHLYHLQQGLRNALGNWTYPDMPFLQWEFEERMPKVPAEKIAELRYFAHELFEKKDVRDLVGKDLKYSTEKK